MQHQGKRIIKYLKRSPGYPELWINECNLPNSAFFIGANDGEEIDEFAEAREDWFKIFLKLPNSIPSHDTFDHVFSLIDLLRCRNILFNG